MNPDLWWALRGGGNQFAVITNLKLQAHPAGDGGKVWGGIRTYNPSKRKELFKAITNFVRDYPDAKAAVIPTFQFGAPLNLINIIGSGPLFFFFYDGAQPPKDVFADFDAIEASKDDTGTKSYWELTNEAGGAAPLPGFGASFRENTFPNMQDEQMAEFYEVMWQKISAQSFVSSVALDVKIMGFDPQPVSVRIARASNAQGGNALGLDPNHGDRIWVENNYLWANPLCNDNCPGDSKRVMQSINDYHMQNYANVTPTNYKSGDPSFIK